MATPEDDFYDTAPPIEYGTPGPIFSAEYDSDCSEGDRIHAGEPIQADGHGGFAHPFCIRQAAKPVIWE